MNIKIGIISYLPSENDARLLRIERLERLLGQLKIIFPEVEIIIIAQNWLDYTYNYDYLTIIEKPKLGILKARMTLREELLKSKGDYFILFDDDAIIEYTEASIKRLYQLCGKNPKGFAFRRGGKNLVNPYADSQLNFAVLSRYILEKEPVPKVDPQRSEGFEDRVWTMLLHVKYAGYEFLLPPEIKCTHFRNTKEPAPSTWSQTEKYNWKHMRQNTVDIENYILWAGDLPPQYKNS